MIQNRLSHRARLNFSGKIRTRSWGLKRTHPGSDSGGATPTTLSSVRRSITTSLMASPVPDRRDQLGRLLEHWPVPAPVDFVQVGHLAEVERAGDVGRPDEPVAGAPDQI